MQKIQNIMKIDLSIKAAAVQFLLSCIMIYQAQNANIQGVMIHRETADCTKSRWSEKLIFFISKPSFYLQKSVSLHEN